MYIGYYEQLKKRFDELTPKVKTSIDVDLIRVGSENDEIAIEQLKNVLYCFALHNKAIGYSQAMSYFAYSLLLIMQNEEQAFHGLCYILEKHLSCYFDTKLSGLRCDIFIMLKYVELYAPKFFKHCQKLRIDLRTFLTQWFATMFFLNLPKETTYRIWVYHFL